MMGMPKDSVADEVLSSVGSYVTWEGAWRAGQNFRNRDRSSGLKVKQIHSIAEHNIPEDLNLL